MTTEQELKLIIEQLVGLLVKEQAQSTGAQVCEHWSKAVAFSEAIEVVQNRLAELLMPRG